MATVCLVFWAFAIHQGFGAVYLLILGFFVVWSNLGSKQEGDASAYPIFNNFRPLLGELQMDQVEAEMRGMGHLHAIAAAANRRERAAPPTQYDGDDAAAAAKILPLLRNER